MGYGDEILAAGQAQRHFDETGEPSYIVNQRLKPRRHPIWDSNPAIIQADGIFGERCHMITNAPGCRPYIVYPFTAESGWTFNRSFHAADHIAKIYLTPEELIYGRSIPRPFVLIEPFSKHANLTWPFDHWCALVAQNPDISFVQHTHRDTGTLHVPGAMYTPQLTFRQACGVLNFAACYVRGESGMCHAAAALGVPTVTIWGGCMDWSVLGGYPLQIGVGVNHPPCGRYLPCDHCRKIMQSIEVDTVAAAIRRSLDREVGKSA